jgi:hypothetical protein
MTKTFIPTGGVIMPIFTTITIIMLNQIRVKPSPIDGARHIKGKRIGTASRIIARESTRQPRIR